MAGASAKAGTWALAGRAVVLADTAVFAASRK